jgi:hypothetical protein
VANEIIGQQLRALTGAERRLLETVLIINIVLGSVPVNPGSPSQFVALFLRCKQRNALTLRTVYGENVAGMSPSRAGPTLGAEMLNPDQAPALVPVP